MLESGPLYYQKRCCAWNQLTQPFDHREPRIEEVKEALNVIEHLNEGSDLECVQKEGIKFTQSASMIGRIDMSRCVMAGHSFGGITALQTAAADRRFTACVVQDAWMIPCDEGFEAEYPSIPRLFINTSKFQWDANFKKQTAVMKGKDEKYGRDNARMVAICKSLHQNQSDLPLLYPALMRYMSMGGEIDAVKAAEMCVDATLVFLRKYFNNDVIEKTKAAVESVLEGGPPTEVYPELVHGKTNE
ncbi:hypothetical protein SARC_04383 [Sphaeroforma arctica JP610]|uniref:1-alkyl-2-acetylglycerophosphocholine esterase n=1 Tax=Sphaeroforma arctica JP610 TaxID=667725 RepID=A0A0L0G2S0_9EUKA|nr:hypothetical protein SARC_04383 [Sphaeroforma arctica JP610]KNC83375.1 hypothetical protein SARC_04383 [Sphaeroforma arctica JP610]|eukprot:XP_014157277.1 hypothetical protein SARC_04383 [Sphaeroforma arctica JP610]